MNENKKTQRRRGAESAFRFGSLLKINCILFALLLSYTMNVSAQKTYMLVGTYTSGKSEGVYVFSFDAETAETSKLSSIFTNNPSFLSVSKDQKNVYAVNESQPGEVTSFAFDKNSGSLSKINSKPSGGDHPCYIVTDKSGKWLLVGNYSGGNFSLLQANKNGELSGPKQTVQHEGSSVVESRQEMPHVHATVLSPDNKYVFVTDLGIDKIMIYRFDAKKGVLKPAKIPFEITEPGAGPRHFVFHPNGKYAYLMEELSGSVSVYGYHSGQLNLLQNLSALPHDYLGPVGSADIHVSPDGKFVYASNRGESNTIAIFTVKSDGTLWPVEHVSTLGSKPRHFSIDPSGNFLLVANQDSHEIVVFKRDKATGLLTDTGKRIQVPSPVCIKWIGE